MYIIVKYGKNESLICNPSCSAVNLLDSIKRRAGFANQNVSLDLSDDTGLVKELDMHKLDYASKYLISHSTYILVEKQLIPEDEDNMSGMDGGSSTPVPPQYNYLPKLENAQNLFPNFKLRVDELQKKNKRRTNSGAKSPSPAGRVGSKSRIKRNNSKPKK